MSYCGVWATPRRLFAVLAHDSGELSRAWKLPRTEAAHGRLVGALVSRHPGCSLVVIDELHRGDPLPSLALESGLAVCTVSAQLLEDLVGLGDRNAGPERRAAILATMPQAASIRPLLARKLPAVSACQSKLW